MFPITWPNLPFIRKTSTQLPNQEIKISGTNRRPSRTPETPRRHGGRVVEGDHKPRWIAAATTGRENWRDVATDTAKFLGDGTKETPPAKSFSIFLFGRWLNVSNSVDCPALLLPLLPCWPEKGSWEKARRWRDPAEDRTGFSDLCPDHARFSFLPQGEERNCQRQGRGGDSNRETVPPADTEAYIRTCFRCTRTFRVNLTPEKLSFQPAPLSLSLSLWSSLFSSLSTVSCTPSFPPPSLALVRPAFSF